MKRYVCGFAISEDESKVLLIRKNKPEWMRGFLNGLGGKIEEGETPLQAMCREFQEEAGLLTTYWTLLGRFSDDDTFEVYFFYKKMNIDRYVQKTDEEIGRFFVSDLYDMEVVTNLRWLIPLCLDDCVNKPIEFKGLE